MKNLILSFAIVMMWLSLSITSTFAQHDGYFLPSNTSPEIKDTTINGWHILYISEPQGSIQWSFEFIKDFKNSTIVYCYSVDGKFLSSSASVTNEKGHTIGLESPPPMDPPIPISSLGWVKK